MRKYGIIIMSGFGAVWGVQGLVGVGMFPLALAILLPLAVSATLIAYAVKLPVTASAAGRKKIGRAVGCASCAEFIAIAAANTALASTGHAAFAVCATAAIVGLHFLPLAHFLQVPLYYLTGAAMVTLAATGCAIGDGQMRSVTVCLGAAGLLWSTCLAVFRWKTDAGLLSARA